MDSWAAFQNPLEQFSTAQQPQAHPPRYPFISAQQTTNLLVPPHSPSLSQDYPAPIPQDTRITTISDAELTTAPMDPAPKRRKKKAPTLRAKDWEPYKARILELHTAQNLPLTKVKEMIEEEFKFSAELRQYRTRITQWGKDKNIKPAEMTAIVRKRQQRRLVEVDKGEQIFSVRGRDVEPHKIDRWMARHEVSQTSLYAPSPIASTPSAILCRTVSERGSVAPSPAFSTVSLDFSTKNTRSTTASPMNSSPVTFTTGIGYPQSGLFNIQNHVHVYQPASTMSLVRQTTTSDVVPLDQPRQYKKAEEEAAREELSVAESSFGDYHSQTLRLRLKLGDILSVQGRYRHAEDIARKTVEDCEKTENTHNIKLDALQLLGEVLYRQGSYHQSHMLQEQLFEWGKVNLGKEHPFVVQSMVELSWNYFGHGNVKEGEELCAQALKISREAFGESHYETINAMTLLLHMYTRQGRLNEAERLGHQLVTEAMAVFGDRHIWTVECMSRLAFVYFGQGRSNESEELQRRALEMSVHLLGEDHLLTIEIRHKLLKQYKSQGRLEDAQNLAERVLAVAQRVFGGQHHETLISTSLLIEIYEDRGQIAKAKELKEQKRMLERQEEDVGLDFSFMTA